MRRAFLLLVTAAMLGAACTPGGSDASSPSTSGPALESTTSTSAATTTTSAPDGYGGHVVLGVQDAPTTLNPFDKRGWGSQVAGNAIWAKVFDRDPDTWDLIPNIVTGLPSEVGAIEVNANGTMTVRYEIVRGATWSDGEPITGEDFAWTAAALRDIALTGAFGQNTVLAEIVEVDSVDRLAFVTFERPTLEFESELWIVLPSHVLDGVDLMDDTDGSEWPSAGPFVVEAFEPGRSVTLARNDSYFGVDDDGSALPYLDGLSIVGVAVDSDSWSEGDLVDRFLEREFHVAELPRFLPEIERARGADGAVVEVAATPFVEHLTFQFGDGRFTANENSMNDELRVRKAIAGAIDREALAVESAIPWTPVAGFLDPVNGSWPDADAGAEGLVDEIVGDTGVAPVTVLSTTGNADERPAVAEALTDQLGAVGIDYDHELLDSTLFFGDVLATGAFDVGMWAWTITDPVDAMRRVDPSLDSPDGDFGSWGTLDSDAARRFTEIRIAAESTVSRGELDALVAEAEQILAAELPLIPLFARAAYAAHWPDLVSGVRINGTEAGLTWNVQHWQVPGE